MIEALIALACGALIIGSIYLKIRRFEWKPQKRSLQVSLLVYVAMFVGLLFVAPLNVVSFGGAVGSLLYFETSDEVKGLMCLLIFCVVTALAYSGIYESNYDPFHEKKFLGIVVGRGNKSAAQSKAFWMSPFAGGILLGIILGLYYIMSVFFSSDYGAGALTLMVMTIISVLSALAGIILTAVTMSALIVSIYQTGSIDIVSLTALIELVPGQSLVISTTIMILSTVIGAIDFSMKNIIDASD